MTDVDPQAMTAKARDAAGRSRRMQAMEARAAVRALAADVEAIAAALYVSERARANHVQRVLDLEDELAAERASEQQRLLFPF